MREKKENTLKSKEDIFSFKEKQKELKEKSFDKKEIKKDVGKTKKLLKKEQRNISKEVKYNSIEKTEPVKREYYNLENISNHKETYDYKKEDCSFNNVKADELNLSSKDKIKNPKEKDKNNYFKNSFKEESIKNDYSFNEFKADVKNLKLEKKKLEVEAKKVQTYKKLRKKHNLEFRNYSEFTNENGDLEYKASSLPKINKEVAYDDNVFIKGKNLLNDTFRNKIHREITKSEEDNTTVKSLHTLEKFGESKLIYHTRMSNYRNINKYNKLDKKIDKLNNKQKLNDLNVKFKDNKEKYKKVVKKQRQKRQYQKMMYREVRKVRFLKRVKNATGNILSFVINPASFILSLNGIFLGFIIFIILFLISLFSLIFSTSSQSGNIYEIQKAELYYREMEAMIEYNNGKRLNHNPIDLASFLTLNFGEFTFEDVKAMLDELIEAQYSENKNLIQIIEENLSEEQQLYFNELYESKCGFIKYGSPFNFDYEPYITSYIGYRINPTSNQTELQLHKGLDIGVPGGTPILAISDGVVTRANFSTSYGNIVEIMHDDGYISRYAHQQSLNVTAGQNVKKGDVIGFVGTTGDSTGNHLHLELFDENGEFMNPIFFIARSNETFEEKN